MEEKEKPGLEEVLAETKHLLNIRKISKNKLPKFAHQESWRYKRISPSWRKPKGIDSKMRLKKKGRPKLPRVGYRSPKKIRGFHPLGYEELIVNNINDLENIDEKKQIVRIAHTVGFKKKLKIVERAKELKIHIINPGGEGKVESKESEKISS